MCINCLCPTWTHTQLIDYDYWTEEQRRERIAANLQKQHVGHHQTAEYEERRAVFHGGEGSAIQLQCAGALRFRAVVMGWWHIDLVRAHR